MKNTCAIIPALLLFHIALSYAGVTVWKREYMDSFKYTAASPLNPDTLLSMRVAPGEYEPVAFAVRSDESTRLTLTFSSAGIGGRRLPTEWIELHQVTSRTSSSPINRLTEIEGSISLSSNKTSFFWITVHPPEEASQGIYTTHLLADYGAVEGPKVLILQCEVLPFRLEKSEIIGGVFMASIDLPLSYYQDMKAHGLDAIQYFWFGSGAIVVGQQDGEMTLDFTVNDRVMEKLSAAGMNGPVVPSLGNDNILSYEIQIGLAYGMPIDTSESIGGKTVKGPEVTGELDSLFTLGLARIRDHWEQEGIEQEVVVLIYDEPTERLLDRHKDRYDLLKTVMPDTRVYGVVMNRRAWAESMLDQCDIIVGNGDFLALRNLAQENDKDYWVYGAPLQLVNRSRYQMGMLPWRVEASGAWFWMYNYWNYDPDYCAIFPHSTDPDKLIRSTAWEGIREGMDDLHYFATAEHLIQNSAGETRTDAETKLDQIRSSIDLNSTMSPESLREVRDKLIDIILSLSEIEERSPCDVNGDGTLDITDVISLLLIGRAYPEDPRADYNEDGEYSIADAIALLIDIISGNCAERAGKQRTG